MDHVYAVEIANEHARLTRVRSARRALNAEDIDRARELRRSGMTLRRVAATLGVGESTIYLALKAS